jgi:hypothetical protein
MSSLTPTVDQSTDKSRKNRVILFMIVGLIAVLLASVIVGMFVNKTANSGALFTGTDETYWEVATGKVDVQATDELRFGNVLPGKPVTRDFTVTNTGTSPAMQIFGQPLKNQIGNVDKVKPENIGLMYTAITGPNGEVIQPLTPMSQLDPYVNLGVLGVGETRTYTVTVLLDEEAGEDWEDVWFAATHTLTATQH